jgi:hypothetical protein
MLTNRETVVVNPDRFTERLLAEKGQAALLFTGRKPRYGRHARGGLDRSLVCCDCLYGMHYFCGHRCPCCQDLAAPPAAENATLPASVALFD